MAVITSVQSGLWSAAATWGGAVPAAGDDITISTGHTVTLDAQFTSEKSTTNNGTLTLGADLLLGNGTTIAATKDCTFTFGPGSLINGTGAIRPRCGKIISAATTANWAKMGGTAAWGYPTVNGRVAWDLQYVSFANGVEQAFATAGNPGSTTTPGLNVPLLKFTNCVFADLPALRFGTTSYTRAITDFIVESCDIRNIPVLSVRNDGAAPVGPRLFKNNTFLYNKDATIVSFVPGQSGPFTYDGNVQLNYVVDAVYGPGGEVYKNGFYSRDNKATPVLIGITKATGTIDNCYAYLPDVAPVNSNPHTLTASHVLNSVIENYGSEPNMIIGPAPATLLETSGNLGIGNGDLATTLTSSPPRDWTVKNNTLVGNTLGVGSIVIVETQAFIAATSGMTVRNNLHVSLADTQGTSYLLGGPLANGMTADADYNAQWNMEGWAKPGYVTNSNPGLNNQIIDPQFVDPTRDFLHWCEFGGPGIATHDYKDGWAYMASMNGYDDASKTQVPATAHPDAIVNLMAWVREGYRPQNAILATAGEGGTYIGAIPLGEGPLPPVDNYTLDIAASVIKVAPGATATITATLKNNGLPAQGKAIAWSLDNASGSGGDGSLSAASGVTNANGVASVTFTATAEGSISIIADYASTVATVTLMIKTPSPEPEGGSVAFRFFEMQWG